MINVDVMKPFAGMQRLILVKTPTESSDFVGVVQLFQTT